MQTQLERAIDWLIRHAHYDEKADEVYYLTEDQEKKPLKVYRRDGRPAAIYVDALAYQVGWQRGIECIRTRRDPGSSFGARRAAEERWTKIGTARSLPRNVYPLSNGMYIGRRGKLKTHAFASVEEVVNAITAEEWVP